MTIYFDHNATTPLDGEVLNAMLPYLEANYANPSSLHSQGRVARNAINVAREQVADLINSHPSQVIFTSGGTEANNLAIKGTLRGMGIGALSCSAIEHPSIRDVLKYFDGAIRNTELAVSEHGLVLENQLAEVCGQETSLLVSVMMANNETGVVQDIAKLAKVVRNKGHFMHTDAVQALGKIPIDYSGLGVHLMTLSSHKIYGPKGVGALIYDKAINIDPLFHGGGQEQGLRPGTENIAAIVGFGKAAEIAKLKLEKNQNYMFSLREYFESRLLQIPGVVLFSSGVDRLANTSFFSVPGIDGETLLMQMDEFGIAVTSGSACSSKSELPSHVLLAMGVDESLARNAIRVSFGLQNTQAEIDEFFKVLETQLNWFGLLNTEA